MLPAADSLAALLAPTVEALAAKCQGQALLVPVPLYKSKQRQREFNQSELIARAALKRLPKESAPSSSWQIPFCYASATRARRPDSRAINVAKICAEHLS